MSAEYAIYIEDYVLSYLRREVDSLELSEIFFYGKRENGGRKFLVYGAGRSKEIAAFADYELLEELVCRLTQAGPVFMVREKGGEYKVSGFRTFYADNAAMQDYLIEWTGGAGDYTIAAKPKEKRTGQAAYVPVSAEIPLAEDKRAAGGAISAQLCLILVVLVAIVISSANSYDKMQRLNQSAKEVFFAIENQEAGQESGKNKTSGVVSADGTEERDTGAEILVERDTSAEDISVEEAVRAENAGQMRKDDQAGDDSSRTGTAGQDDENGNLKNDAADSTEGKNREEEELSGQEDAQAGNNDRAEEEDVSEEALSRNITRYYEVERGDTLYTISQKIYGDTSRVEKICEVNEISDPDKISEGQRIILP
ncbi:MAG: LysM peptidoglycan-binding domain-containing protein [Bacteroidales bacterium]|nr:LysM peptidoglycan-binding domain-containing protein [Bacteroidales bacterium]MCM1414949.1 LysM peptidoglycan-binding domain-containing protein [bacterium]MCM1424795.1 LysM peptidoglycan-binding domain-containing protein [bacterium]